MAINHDVQATIKMVLTQVELEVKDNIKRPPKTQRGQSKIVLENNTDAVAIRVPATELKTRLADMLKCYYYGYRVDPLDHPPVVETDAATVVTNAAALLNGRVTGAGCTVGFQLGKTKEFELGSVVATGSPTGVQATIKQVTYAWIPLTSKTTYYFRVFAQYTATGNTQYGIMKSFTTL
jgi:hypothetical protein